MTTKKDLPVQGRSRRDFLAKSGLFTAGVAAGGLAPLASLGANNPLEIAPPGAKIERLAIFPTLGVCRVGNSPKHFLAPEIPGIPANGDDGYGNIPADFNFKDGTNLIMKQAQRFRIFGFDSRNRVVGEVTADDNVSIEWTVQMANNKGAWYEFNNPLDMGKYAPGMPGKLRNNFYVGEDRAKLEIVSDPVTIPSGEENQDGEGYKLEGKFWHEPYRRDVKLGHLQTDGDGRLIVVPGDGVGKSANGQSPIDNFADNDGWYDDWADGYVRAKVTMGDEEMEVTPAWVACSGPNFAPEIEPFITMYDVVRDVMVYGKKDDPFGCRPKGKISFRKEIYPLFRRLGLMEWTTAASNFRQGWIEIGDYLNEEYIERLANPSTDPDQQAFRDKVFATFRSPAEYKLYDNDQSYEENIQYKVPYMLGSGVNYSFSPAHWFAMPQLQYDILTEWKNGNFVNDLFDEKLVDQSGRFEDIEADLQPMALTRAALEPLSGGAFHPGVELTWPLRQQGLYSDEEPFRIKQAPEYEPMYQRTERLGLYLTPEVAFKGAQRSEYPSGESYSFYNLPEDCPVGPQHPGDLTRWLGLPWHPDAFSCQQVMYSNDFPNAAWWPALLPIDILPEYCFNQLERDDLSDEEKLKFFNDRQLWTRGVAGIGYHVQGSYDDGLERMIALWSKMGFVLARKRPENLSENLKSLIPEWVFVETGRGSMDLYTDSLPNEGLPNGQ